MPIHMDDILDQEVIGDSDYSSILTAGSVSPTHGQFHGHHA